ncbi:MAG: fumarylacetoacetate hydrolase family protein [Anaerolineae bacterium]|nr:fumarylacetoacetate hydrolase family protein [Anaerolineae bacterium]
MRLLTYKTNRKLKLGIKTEAGIINVRKAGGILGIKVPASPKAFYAGGMDAMPALHELVDRALGAPAGSPWMLDENKLGLGPCVTNPEKILCVGLNYRRHAAESGAQVPEVPVFFSKFNNALTGSGDVIRLPAAAEKYDYEVELAVVIGKKCKNVPVASALDCVLGYSCANDISARDLQLRTSQWLLGKTLDGFCPLGPYMVTADEVADPQKLVTRSWLNGELRQNSNTADMVFSVAQIISYASQYMTLKPGDIILTGTPEGVILGMEKRVWMKPGDEVAVEVGNLGKLSNALVAE